MTATDRPSVAPPAGLTARPAGRPQQLRDHLRDPLYRTGYLLTIGTGLGALLGFVFWALAANDYPAKVVGRNAAAISAMMLVSGICSLGLNAVLVRYLPTAGRATRALIVRTYALTAALALVLGAVAALTSGIWSPRLSFLANDPEWLIGFTLATVVWTIFTLQDSVITGLRAAQWVPIENGLFSAAKLVVLVAVVGALPAAGPFVAWNAPVALAVAAISVLIFRRLIPRHIEQRGDAQLDTQQMIRVAWGNYGGTLFGLTLTMLMPVLVANINSVEATAYFYVPWTIAISVQLLALNMTTSLTVEAAMDEGQLRRLGQRTLAQTMRLLVPLVVVVGLAAPLILGLFGGRYAEEGSTLLRLLVAGSIPNVFAVLGLAVARVQHKGRAVLAIQAAECILLLGLSAILLPGMGIEGVGVAWLVSQLTVAGALLASLLRPVLLPVRRSPAG
jgi:O-antigen/teichoic acid export membrane protein